MSYKNNAIVIVVVQLNVRDSLNGDLKLVMYPLKLKRDLTVACQIWLTFCQVTVSVFKSVAQKIYLLSYAVKYLLRLSSFNSRLNRFFSRFK